MKMFLEGVPEKLVMGLIGSEKYVAKISRELGFTYSHVTKIVGILEKQKIIKKQKIGRKIKIELTEKGLKLQEHLNDIKRLIR